MTFMLCGVMAQAPVDPQFDPSDVYFQAYLEVRAAEQLEKDGDFMGALKKYGQAGKLFDSVGKFYPDWKAGMVQNRRDLTAKAVEVVRGKAGEQFNTERGVIAELEGGVEVGAAPDVANRPEVRVPDAGLKPLERAERNMPVVPLEQGILQVDPLQARRLKDAEAELERLRRMISEADAKGNEAMRNTTRLQDFQKQNEALSRQLKEAEASAQALREKLSALPVQSEASGMKEAEAEIARLRKMISEADAGSNQAMRNATRLQDMQKQNDSLTRQLKAAEANAQALRANNNQATKPSDASAMKEAAAELARLRKMISEADARSNEAMRNAARLQDMQKQNDFLSRQLKAAETNVQSLRAEMAGAPVRSEMTALNNQIEKLEQEREAMGMALRTSRGDHTQALSKIEILTADMDILKGQVKELRQAEANLNRDLKKERDVANDVVKGQRRQMDALEKALGEKSKELEEAHGQIVALRDELDESRDAFAELRQERDSLLQERDQMAALLKLNEADRTQDLIEQNMGLAKLLREANEKVERLNLDNNAAKDDVVDALRDLAIAKSQINRLQQAKKDQAKRLEELTDKLKAEDRVLAQGDANSAEVEMLREVIKRQLTAQERRRQAKEIVIEAAKQLGEQDERLGPAIELLDGDEMALTPEEQKLVANQQVDGEFISPFARDRVTVGRATAELNREMESYDRAATKAYLAGRLLPTRELFELMVEQNPGHVPALCKLGIVQLKLDQPGDAIDSFRKAVELDENNPYANRMLGFAQLKTGDLTAAELHLKRAVALAPDDAKGYLLLGITSNQLGQKGDAEENFKSAISADPLPSEPYFNLALLYAKLGRLGEGREYYNMALERGAVPDPALEGKLRMKP
jgi:tetratricopeptide (TPR) repeat protein